MISRLGLLLVAAALAGLLGVPAKAATITVNSTNDPAGFDPDITIAGLGATVTLRDAFNAAVNTLGDDTIVFDAALAGQTIGLTHVGGAQSALAAGAGNKPIGDLTVQGLVGGQGITIARIGDNDMRLFISLTQGTLTLNDLTLRGGRLPGGWGGNVQVSAATLVMNRCTVTAGFASFGGGIYNVQGYAYLRNCTIVGNQASDQGGGLYLYTGSQSTLINCTITGNSALQGGGLHVQATPYPLLENTIVAHNNVLISLPEIFGQVASDSRNNLCSDPGTTAGLSNGAGNMVNGVNGNILGANPMLGLLQNNGGPTDTMLPDPASPAINAGATVGDPTNDQRGALRPMFGAYDIGACELTAFDTGQTVVNAGGAYWYMGRPVQGDDLTIYREEMGLLPVVLDGFALLIGQAGDGTVLVRNSGGNVYSRTGSTGGIGSGWDSRHSVFAGDGATWFLGPDSGPDGRYIYRWDDIGAPQYSSGAGTNLSVRFDGSIMAVAENGSMWRRLGSTSGLGTEWQQVFPVVVPPALQAPALLGNGSVQLAFTNDATRLFTIHGSTNLTDWILLGEPIESPPGHYQFTDPEAGTYDRRFYLTTSP